MAEDKIRHDDLIERDVFRDSIDSAKSFENELTNLIGTIQKVGAEAAKNLGGNPQNLAQLKQQQQAIQDIANADLVLTEAQKQRIAVAETLSQLRVTELKQKEELKRKFAEENRLEKEKLRAQKQSQDAYGKLSAKHRELVREAKNLAVAYGAESKEARNAANAANVLDKQLKNIDASVGQHQRNVGNYSSALKGFGQNILGAFGISFGIGAVVTGLKESIVAFAEAEKNARALEFALKNVAGEGTAAFDKLITQSEKLQESGGIFSDDDIQKAQLQLVNYGLLSDEVTELMPKILDLASAQGIDLATATDIAIKAINGQTKGLKTSGIAFDDTGSRAENYTILLDKLTKFEGAAADAATTTEGKYYVLMSRFDDLKEDIGEFLVDTGSGFLDWFDQATGKVSALTAAMNFQNEALSRQREEALALARSQIIDPAKTKEEQLAELRATTNLILADFKDARAAYDAANVATNDPRWDDLAKDRQNAILRQQRLKEELSLYLQIQDEILHPEKYKTDTPKTFDERTGDGDKDGGTKKAAEEYVYTWEDALKDLADFENKLNDDELERAKEKRRIEKHQMKLWLDDQKEKQMREEAAYRKKKEAQKKQQEEDEKRRKEELEDLIRMEELFSDATFEGINKRLDAKEKALQEDGENIDRELQIQSERQLAGLDNTYAEVSRLKAENEAKQAEIAEKRRKAEEAKEFADLFVEFTKAYAKDGSINAASKALAETIAVRAIANSIAGNFAEGVENFKGKGTGTSDSNIIGFSNGESVVTAKGTSETAGLVSAINSNGFEGAKDWAMDHIFKPQLMASMIPEDSPRYKNGQVDWYQSALLNELVDLKKTVKDKPEYGLTYNDAEKVFESQMKHRGITKVLKHKRF